jgi:methionyl-tRNA synthetase
MRRLAACCLLTVAVAACSEPPDKERHQAEGAIEAARAAGAETYAPVEFQDAQSALKKYEDAVAQRDYRQALNDALEARDRAYEAAKQAGNKKAEDRGRADRLVSELDALVAAASTRLTSTTARPVGPSAERLRASRDAARQTLQEARSRMAHQDYASAANGLTSSIEKLRKELPAPEPPAPKRKK